MQRDELRQARFIGRQSYDLLGRSQAALQQATELIQLMDGTQERNAIYSRGIEALSWLIWQPGYIKKTDLRAILTQIRKELGESLIKDAEKLGISAQIEPNQAENAQES